MSILIIIGAIALLGIVFYFVIKGAVRNGINESMLFTDEQGAEQDKKDQKEHEEAIKEHEGKNANDEKRISTCGWCYKACKLNASFVLLTANAYTTTYILLSQKIIP